MSSSSIAKNLPKLFGVVGSGQMGSGITQVLALAGREVVLTDNSEAALERAKSHIMANLDRSVAKDDITGFEAEIAMDNITFTGATTDLGSAEYVIEAVSEDPGIKSSVFKMLNEVTAPSTILATNTSSISITSIAANCCKPSKVIGMHWMNPAPVMNLIEIVKGMQTSDATFEVTKEVARHCHKGICLSQDRPGFVVNRVLMPMINEAFFVLMEGVASPADIDRGMKQGTNQPMGPLTLADFIGLDTCLAVMKVLYEGTSDSKYRPCPLLVQYVDAGWVGRKSGRGVYDYSDKSPMSADYDTLGTF